MDYFRKYLGAQQDGTTPTGAETIKRLCDRVQSSTLLEDRRDAVRALKSLSKKFRQEVGIQAMDILTHVLQTDRGDTEIMGYAIETLCNVMSNEPLEDDEGTLSTLPDDLGSQFSERFIKTNDNVAVLLSLLEEYDFHVRWPTVKLLTILLVNMGRDLQEAILVSPMGVSKLMDLLSDSREIIRNDGLLLLIQLTKSNANIQKIVAFENAFERLLDIISEEGNSDGGIVVEDCLLLMLNLLKNNSSNQNFFKEGSFIQRLPPYFELQPADKSPQGGWSAQKVTNIHLMLQLVRTLVSPSNPQQQTVACQKVMNICGLLQQLSVILMATGVPADVLSESINTVSEVIRGNHGNQEYFASVMAPSNPPRIAIVVLLMSMVNENQPFVLRCAVLYCFQSFLYKNELGQSQIIQTLLPSTADANSVSAGQLLCGGLFSSDPLSTWFASVALLHAIVDNAEQKEQLLRVQLATSLGNPAVSLLQQCTDILGQCGAKLQMQVGLLMLLSHWLAYCPIAVTHFLHNPKNVPFFISQVSASEGDDHEALVQGLCAFLLGICVHFNTDQVENCTRDHLRQIIEKRIGMEQFVDKLSQVSKHESYNSAAKQPQLNFKQPSDVLIDHAFTKLFKKLENEVVASMSPAQESDGPAKRHTVDQHDSIVGQYKELIREQDLQLNLAKAELTELKGIHEETVRTLTGTKQQIQQLKDQNALLKAQRGGSVPATGNDTADISKLTKEIDEKNAEVEKLKSDLVVSDAKIAALTTCEGNEGDVAAATAAAAGLRAQVIQLEAEVIEYKKKVEQREEEVRLYKAKYDETSKQVAELGEKLSSGSQDEAANSTALLVERNSLLERISNQEKKIQEQDEAVEKAREEKKELQYELDAANTEKTRLKAEVQKLEVETSEAEADKLKALEEAESQRKEQEDLLVLLADQDGKLSTYKKRLRQLGEKIDDDDDDDDDDSEED